MTPMLYFSGEITAGSVILAFLIAAMFYVMVQQHHELFRSHRETLEQVRLTKAHADTAATVSQRTDDRMVAAQNPDSHHELPVVVLASNPPTPHSTPL